MSDLQFLPSDLLADPCFQRRWKQAVSMVRVAAKSDKDRGSKKRKDAIRENAGQVFCAARLLRNEIDGGGLIGLMAIDSFSERNRFSSEDVETVRRFLNLLAQDVFCFGVDAIKALPEIRPKQATRTAAYFAGRLCAEFNLGAPRKYVSVKPADGNVSANLMRALLAESDQNDPSIDTLKRCMESATEGYIEFNRCKTSLKK